MERMIVVVYDKKILIAPMSTHCRVGGGKVEQRSHI
jgi:hypothetical protein